MNSVCRPKYKKGLERRLAACVCQIANNCSGRPAGQPMPLQSGNEEACNRSKKKQPAPHQIASRAGAPHQPDGHAGEDKQIVKVVANRLQPAPKIGFLKFQASDFTVASVENTCEQRQKRAEQHIPVAAECEEHTRKQS